MTIVQDPYWRERENATVPSSSLQALVNLDRRPVFQFGFGLAPEPVEAPKKKKRKKGERA